VGRISFIREKQFWLAEPIKRLREQEQYQKPMNLRDIGVNLMFASPVLLNALGPAAMINAGIRPHAVFEGVSYARHSPYLKPLFNYYYPPSTAYKTGAKLGSAVGSFLSPTLHNVTSTGVLGKTRTLAKGASGGARVGAKLGGRVGSRLIPGIGWGLLAYDVYDITVNQRLWGFDL